MAEQTDTAKLKLRDVFELIDANHPSLRASEQNTQSARGELLSAYGGFVPKLGLRTTLESFKDSSFKRRERWLNATELSWQTPFAVEVIGGVRTTTGSLLAAESLQYPGAKGYFDDVKKQDSTGFTNAEFNFGLRMPLLKDLMIDEFRGDLLKARQERFLADYSIRLKRAELFLKAAEKYWAWVAAGRKYELARQMLQLAEGRENIIKTRVDLGANPPIDLAEVQSQIQARRDILAKALREVEKNALSLSLFLWSDGFSTVVPDVTLMPAEIPPPVRIDSSTEVKHRRDALERPELLILQAERSQQNVDLRLARNAMLPKVDFELFPTQDLNGLNGGTNIRGSLVAYTPIVPLKAKGMVMKAAAALEKNALGLTETKVRIDTEISDALSALNASRERVAFAAEAVQNLDKLADGERRRFDYGNSNLFNVNLREVAAAEGRIKLIDALADHQTGLAAYRNAIGEWSIPGYDENWLDRAEASSKQEL